MSTPAEDLMSIAEDAGIGEVGKSSAWSLHLSKMPDTGSPDNVIGFFDTGGTASNPKWLIDYPSVQVRVRAGRGDYREAWAKARAVKDALLGLPSQDVDDKRLVAVNMIGDIAFLGYDKRDRPQFSLNFALITEPNTGTNRTSL